MTIHTLAEIAAHNTRESAWLVLSGKVYDATKFLDEHPGGDEVIIAEAGKRDATEAFEDIGHSDEARTILADLLIGTVDTAADQAAKEIKQKPLSSVTGPGAAKAQPSGGLGLNAVLIPVALLGAYVAYRSYFLN
ncbi:cytochrome b5 [Auriculariales sp. MPI-PUGE-AT-0066]|nr:cytochrome b5 [Auriculariales sp. MPI-PUGE-AT-0066]